MSRTETVPSVEDAPFSRAGFFRAAAIVVVIAISLAAGCTFLLLDHTVPRTTAVVLTLVALLPIAFLLYLGCSVAFWAATDRRLPGSFAVSRLALFLQRRV
jgi:hypothetical protein